MCVKTVIKEINSSTALELCIEIMFIDDLSLSAASVHY